MNQAQLLALPKVELHLHLDCSLSYQVVQQLDPSMSYSEYQTTCIAPVKCLDLADYLTRAITQLNLMQTKEALRLVTLDLFNQLKSDNIIYAEIRFAPLAHLEKGLSAEEVVSTVNEAVSEGIQTTGVEAGLILCTLRNFTETQSLETVRLVEAFSGTQVVGFDIAADEAQYTIENHRKAFDFANQHQLNTTAHAGEAKGAESVWETIVHFKPQRIGHGVRSIEDPRLVDYLQIHGLHLEICPTSNVQTNVIEQIRDHPIQKLRQAGISIGINTDGRTISNTTLTEEYQTLVDHFGWTVADFKQSNLAAIEHAFMDEKVKKRLRHIILDAYS